MSTYNCKKGWLVYLDENGEYVPFFMHVREKDIIWDSDSSFMNELIKKSPQFKGMDVNVIFPKIKCDKNGWEYVINSDFSFKARKKVHIGSSNGFSLIDNHTLLKELTIPFLINTRSSYINCMIDSKNALLRNCIVSTKTPETDTFKTFEVYLTSRDEIPDDYDVTSTYVKSFVTITVEGHMN